MGKTNKFNRFCRVRLKNSTDSMPVSSVSGRVFFSLAGYNVVAMYDRSIGIYSDISLECDLNRLSYNDLKVGELVHTITSAGRISNEWSIVSVEGDICHLKNLLGEKKSMRVYDVIPVFTEAAPCVNEVLSRYERGSDVNPKSKKNNHTLYTSCPAKDEPECEEDYKEIGERMAKMTENLIKDIYLNTGNSSPHSTKYEDTGIGIPYNESKKNDIQDDKLRWDLLPLQEIEDIVRVYHAGAKKYGANKWQGLENGYQRYKAALLRHLLEAENGNMVDEDTGCLHLAQVAWNAIAMLHLSKKQSNKKE